MNIAECKRTYQEVLQHISKEDVLAYFLCCLGHVEFSNDIPTACVRVVAPRKSTASDVDGRVSFLFNPKFWSKLTPEERLFLVLHETRHVFSRHASRTFDLVGTNATEKEYHLCNLAADLAVNSSLLRDYTFTMEQLPFLRKNGCWCDTILDEPLDDSLTFEEYFYLLQQKQPPSVPNGFDSHQLTKDQVESILNSLTQNGGEGLTEKQKQDLAGMLEVDPSLNSILRAIKEKINQGQQAGMGDMLGELVKEIKKSVRPWETFARHFTKHAIGQATAETWIPSRRLYMPGTLRLPADHDRDNRARIKVLLFLDTSGSCSTYVSHFLGFAKALPKKLFDIKAWGFTNGPYSLDLKNPKFRTGGTNFRLIAQIVGQHHKPYVFVFTDGYGTPVDQENPERWNWFFFRQNSTTKYCHPSANIYWLEDFEV